MSSEYETDDPDVIVSASSEARQFHTRDEAQADVLIMLRGGGALTRRNYEKHATDGTRLAPIVEQLRNAHGFLIIGHGTSDKPYRLQDRLQLPSLARVSPEMRKAYYETQHWMDAKERRFQIDGYRCVLTQSAENLRCHHISYANLFGEAMKELMTVCDEAHYMIHKHCRLKFPSGIAPHLAERLGWLGFEGWLLPNC